MGRSALIAVLALAPGAAGCGQLSSYRTAEPLGAGTWRAGAAAGVTGFVDTRDDVRTPSGHVELSLRRGVTERLDLGATLFVRGVAVEAQLGLGRNAGWAIAAFGGVGASVDREVNVIGDGVYGQARLGGLASRALSRRWTATAGAQLVLSRYWADAGGHASGVLVGALANAQWAMSARWRLVPELSLLGTVSGQVPVAGAVAQLGVGVARQW